MANPCIFGDWECESRYCSHTICSLSSDCKYKCDECGEIIEDHYYLINNRVYCEDCMKEIFMKKTEY